MLTAVAALAGTLVLAGQATAAFPGVNGTIAFDRDGQILLKDPGNPDAGSPITAVGQNADAAWSPDGLRIAFVSDRGGGTFDLWTMNADGSDPQRRTFESGDVSAPAWSPDGTRIAYAVSNGVDDDLAVIPVDTPGTRLLVAEGPGDQDLAAWTPDGARIVFEDGASALSIVGATGVGRVPFLSDARQPDFSPDGTRLVVTRSSQSLFVVNADGTGGTLLNPAQPAARPVWSPDGSTLVYHRTGGNNGLFRVAAIGGTEARETNGATLDFSPDWQPIGAVPVITGLPVPLTAGAPGATLTVDGRGFAFRSVVRWNGVDRPTTFVSPTRVTAQLAPADVATPRTAQVTVFTRPSGGGLSAPATATVPAPPPPPPRILLGTARVTKATWKASRVTGSFRVAGTLERGGRVEVALVRGPRVAQRRVLTLPAGPFTRTIPLSPRLVPGRYVVRLLEVGTPAGSTPLVATQGAITLSAPPEGVVRAASISAIQGGPAARTLRGKSRIFATFRFAALPKGGRAITTRWIAPNGRSSAPDGRPRRTVVSSFVRSPAGLAAGRWRCELRVRGTLVAVASVRIR